MHDCKNILVTGAHGQLGSEIKKLSSQNENRFYFTDQDELDIANLNDVRNYVIDNKINSIINCA